MKTQQEVLNKLDELRIAEAKITRKMGMLKTNDVIEMTNLRIQINALRWVL